MQLWTDYEGVTIDGAFPLKKLLLPEGRSAFFSTANGKGDPIVLRLIECHFDEEEILARWHSVESLNHANFLKLERYGQIEIDGSPVVYAAFERVDANLAGVLDQGHLSVKDTAQLALSITAALEVLHTHGFVHDHVSAGNIFAVGEVVKLRSDCIREAAEGEAGIAAKKKDIQDLAIVLLQALTRRTSLDGVSESALPTPFDKVVRYGMNGTWGLVEIRTALEGRWKPAPTVKSSSPATATASKPLEADDKKTGEAKKDEQLELWSDNVVRDKMRQDLWDEESDHHYFTAQTKWMAVAGAVVVLFFLSIWFVARTRHAHNIQVQTSATQNSAATKAASPKKTTSSNPFLARNKTLAAQASAAQTAHPQWRVIAYTYNHKGDAEKKAASLMQAHADLQPAVFAPKGRAPYLVSIGGAMERDAAYALAHRAGSLGLPRDTYAQNYK